MRSLSLRFRYTLFISILFAFAIVALTFLPAHNIIIALVMIVLMTVLTSLVLKKLFDRIKKVSDSISDIASGKADLSQSIEVGRDDEIGNLVRTCNQLTANLANMIGSIKESVVMLSQTGDAVTKQAQDAMEDIQAASDAIGEIDTRAKTQSQTMRSLAESGGEVGVAISQLDEKIETQTNEISHVSSSVEEISANIKSIDTNISQITDRYEQLVRVSNKGQNDQIIVAEKVDEIHAQAKHLREANTVVAKLASQTNLLAMNAAIEAAHAGQAGAGFAVVANEIRNLAENSSKQSKSIAGVIKTITDTITAIVDASKLSLSSFQDVDKKIGEIQGMIAQVKSSISEQEIGTKNLLDSMMLINSSSQSLGETSRMMKKHSIEVFGQIDLIKDVADEIMSLSEHTQNSINTISQQAKNSSEAAGKNLEMSGKVFEIIENFKV